MKILKYILGFIIFIGLGNVLYGQVSISTASPNPACIGEVVTIIGNDMKPTYLKLKQGGGVNIDLSGNIQAGATTTQIKVLLSSAIIGAVSGTVEFEVEKNTGVAGTSKATKSFVLNPTPQVTLSVQGGNNTVCSGGSATLNFTVSNSGGGSVLINYTKGGTPATTTATGDGVHSVVVSPITTPTIYTVVSAKLTTCTNVTTITGQSETITITPTPTVALAIQGGNNTICPGQNAILNFTVANSGGANVTINYTVNGVAAATVASGNGVHSVIVSPTVQTDYVVTSATIGTCTTSITNQDETIDIDDVADVTLSVQGGTNTICSGESATLNFTVSNSGGGNVTIHYSKNGVVTTTTANGNGVHAVPVTPMTTTLYTIISTTTATGCAKTITNQSQTITVQPNITGTLTASTNAICNGESVSLFFTANNPNNNPLIFHYSDGTNNLTTTTAGTFVSVSSGALSAETTFTLNTIENTTTNCTKNITTNNTETIAVNNTMGVLMTSSVSSLCFGGSYDLIFAITGSKANDDITILYSQDGVTIPLNVTINATNTNTLATVNFTGNQSRSHSLVSITNNTTGCFTNYLPSAVNTIQINVTPPISTSISASSTAICEGVSTNLIFSVANPNNELITIKYTDGTTVFTETTNGNSKVVSVSPTSTSTYTLTSVQTVACLFSFVANNSVTITVNKVPTVTVALSGNGIACSGTSAQLTFTITNKNSPTDAVTVQYLDNNGLQSFTTTAATETIAVAPPTTTVYSLVSITNTTVGCTNFNVSSGAGSNVTVVAGNNLTGELQVSTNEICEGQNVTLNFIINGASGSTDLTYTVDGVPAPTLTITGSTANVTLPLTTSTIFKLIGLTAVSTGCPGDTISGSSTKNVRVNTLPNAILTTVNGSNTTAICNGQATDLQFNITGGTPPYSVAYIETVSGFNTNLTFNSAGTTPVSVNPIQTSVYNISTVVDAKLCADATPTGTANVTVNPLPTASFTINDNTLCNGETAILTFTVSANANDNVTVTYNEVSNGVTTPKTVTTNNSTTVTVTPNLTTTYTITSITNAVTNCVGTPNGNSLTITVNELPEVSLAIIGNSTVCNGINSTLEFTFSNGISPFTVFYQDSFSNQNSRSAEVQWNNLTFNSILNLPQINNTISPITHTYFITKVIDGNGCTVNYPIATQPEVSININPTPNVNLIGVKPTTEPYASTDAFPYVIYGTPGGGTISGAGTGITTFINSDSSQANFIPANAGFLPTDVTRDIILTYSLTDIAGCTGTVIDTARLKKALNYTFYNEGSTTLQTQYCRNSDSIYIFAKIDGVEPLGTNTFVIDGINNTVFSNIQVQTDSVRITLTPQTATTTGSFLMKFGSVESGFITKQITIVDTINTSFSPFIDGAFFCQDFADSIRLIGIPTLDVNNPSGIFSSPTLGLITSNTSNSVDRGWYLQQAISGEHQIIYTYTDNATSCVTTATQAINITPTPVAHFVAAIDCNNKIATFSDNSIFTGNTNGLDSILTWNWQFGDGADSVRLDSLPFDYIYDASGVFNATLNVVSALGCTNSFDTTVIIGVRPTMDFSWRFSTLGENTELVNLSTANVGGTLIDNVNNLTWNFGDGTPDLITTLDTVLHQYPNTGVFQVDLTAETNNGCFSDTTFNVFILPKIETYPYYERFNSSDGEWIANPIAGNFWEWADSLVYNNSNRGWTTDSASTYPFGNDVFVFSPIFDFTTIEKPFITFQYRVNSRVSDGAVLQYSTDDGQTWNVLGDLNSGLEWYNVDNLVAQPGGQTGFVSFGWSGNLVNDWKVARHKLDGLKGEPKVRFRFAFASVAGDNNSNIYDGFAFDDFFIGDRQKRVLIENFTNVGFGGVNYNPIQNEIYQRLNDNDLDVAMVEYHNALPSNDNFNIFNPADPSGRSLYYQFSQTGKTVIDGEIYNTVIGNTTNLEWSQLDLDLAMLEEPEFNIAIDNFNINNGTLDITTTIKARKPLNATTRKVYIAVVEDDLSLNNQTHKSTLRKLLPSSAGTSLTNSWAIGTAQTVTQSWTFNPNEIDATKLNVVIWIQDNNTKKIYQSTSSALPNIVFDSTVVNTKTPLENTENMVFNLFPNPNNGNFTITFSSAMTTETNWQLINISGQIIHQGQIATNQENVNITTNDLPKGMYFFRMYNEKGISEVRKVLVE